MRIVVFAKEVLDPDAVGAYAVSGGLVVDDDGNITQSAIPRLMNGYDEQAIEAALRIKDTGLDCTVVVATIGSDPTAMLRHALSLGADEVVAIEPPDGPVDCRVVASLLAAWVTSSGGAALILCGRQASDDDQGVVPALVATTLGQPLVTLARAVELSAPGEPLRVIRVTPDGDETVEVDLPAVVSVSSELGEPRYPTMPQKMAARKVKPAVVSPDQLPVGEGGLEPAVVAVRQFVPTIKGDCEMIAGDTAAGLADGLVARLADAKLLPSGPPR
jgi:electron transfer flavoprotein beta subunit